MNIDWNNLSFQFMPTKSNIRFSWKDGQWSPGRLCASTDITLSIAANCLHYGQAAFEGQKAFSCQDGKVRVFRPGANSERLNLTASHLLMPEVPAEMFLDAVRTVVEDNIDYVPPYGTGGALYIRPVMVGSAATIGVAPSTEYEFIIMVVPVGPYYKGGIKPVRALINDDFDRAAPQGTGHVKTAGNYAASLKPTKVAKGRGFDVSLFLDAATHEYIEEFGTSNFIAITKDGKYVTPKSDSILGSITNDSLIETAKDLGITVERRPIHKSELADFAEVGACGTAVVITPIKEIVHNDVVYKYGDEMGPVLRKLYDRLTGIQLGELPDTHHWLMEI
jgi:branched-chain amino acid aminotransferase